MRERIKRLLQEHTERKRMVFEHLKDACLDDIKKIYHCIFEHPYYWYGTDIYNNKLFVFDSETLRKAGEDDVFVLIKSREAYNMYVEGIHLDLTKEYKYKTPKARFLYFYFNLLLEIPPIFSYDYEETEFVRDFKDLI